MIRRILMLGMLCTLLMSTAAQDAAFPLPRTIATPFSAPAVEVSPDGTLLAVHESQFPRSEDDTPVNLSILLLDLETGNEVGRLEGVQSDITCCVAFSPDGTQLVSYHINGDLIIWDLTTQEAVQVYDWLPMGGRALDYMPDGESVVFVRHDDFMGQHVLFDLKTGSITDTLVVRPDTVDALIVMGNDIELRGSYGIAAQTVGPNGEIYAANGNGDVYRWDTETRLRELIYAAPYEYPMSYPVRGLQLLADGSLAFLNDDRGELTVVEPDGIDSQYPLNGQTFVLSGDGIAISADGREEALFWIDLNAAEQAPQRIDFLPEGDDGDNPIRITDFTELTFTTEGDLIVSEMYTSGGNSPIFIIDLP